MGGQASSASIIFHGKMTEAGKLVSISQIEELYKTYDSNTRYQVYVLVSSPVWKTNEKTSVWIQDTRNHGITILCCFEPHEFPTNFFKVHGQYHLQNILIRFNGRNEQATYGTKAEYQILLDQHSKIEKLEKKFRISYKPIRLDKIPSKVGNEEKFLDIAAVPVQDLRGDHPATPRRIILTDESGAKITLTLWDDDAADSTKILDMMYKPI